MSHTLEITPASEVPSLRNGFAFAIREGERIRCEGRIKPSGNTIITKGGFPTGSIAARMAFIADLYADEGVTPEDLTFESREDEDE